MSAYDRRPFVALKRTQILVLKLLAEINLDADAVAIHACQTVDGFFVEETLGDVLRKNAKLIRELEGAI